MNANIDKEEKFLLSLSDIVSLFNRFKLKIFLFAVVLGLFGTVYALLEPILYQAEGTFRERGVRAGNGIGSSLLQILGGGSLVSGESETTSLMLSRKILKDVVERLHLQGNLLAVSHIETDFTLFKQNLKLSWAAAFGTSPEPVLKDLICPLKFESLHYSGELPLAFFLELKKDGSFDLFDLYHAKKLVGSGKLGEPFLWKNLSFTLLPTDEMEDPEAQSFCLSVESLPSAVKTLAAILKVDSAKLDKSLLTLKYKHRNRHLATQIVNVVMESYQDYLKNYHSEMALSQLDYLNLRREQLTRNLTILMEKHADYLANDLYNAGFIESNKEMDFLASSQHEYKRKLLDNELEIKRLNNIKPGNLAFYDRYSANEGDTSVINAILAEMRSLKQQRDSLEIEVQKKSMQQESNIHSFEQQLDELKDIQENLVDLKKIADNYEQGHLPELDSKLANDSRFLLKGWFERLKNMQQQQPNNWKEVSENFKFYLNNLERLFSVHERILQERLIHQQNPSGEYQGISLEVATNLYLDYSKQHVQMESTIRQNLFFIHQIEDPNFEITSLSGGLTDSVSNGMIQKASELVLNLRDQNNQSTREQERIKEQLNLQRTFLTLHLKQMVQLMELNKQLIDEKIFTLQNVCLGLIHQRISLLEKNLQEYLKSRLYNLEQEKILIKRHLENIHEEMALLPQKWVSEQLIAQEVDTNQRIVEEIAKLVESKNISHKLESIQSAPVDPALSPVHPLPPKVTLLFLIGFFLGGFLSSGFVLCKTMVKGLNVSKENLELAGYHVSGILPYATKNNNFMSPRRLDTFRRLQSYFEFSHTIQAKPGELLLVIQGRFDYSSSLANLFLKRGLRVLTLDLNFSNVVTDKKGLLPYLLGESTNPTIMKGNVGDVIPMGGTHPFAIELISSERFKALLENLKPQYDVILAVTNVLPCGAEAEILLTLFPNVAAILNEERTEDLGLYSRFLKQNRGHKLTFLLEKKEDQYDWSTFNLYYEKSLQYAQQLLDWCIKSCKEIKTRKVWFRNRT